MRLWTPDGVQPTLYLPDVPPAAGTRQHAARVTALAVLYLLYDEDVVVETPTVEHAEFMSEWGVRSARRAAETSDIADMITGHDIMYDHPRFWLGEFSHSAPSAGIFGAADNHPCSLQMAWLPHIYNAITAETDSPSLPKSATHDAITMFTVLKRLMDATLFAYDAALEHSLGGWSSLELDAQMLLQSYHHVFAHYATGGRAPELPALGGTRPYRLQVTDVFGGATFPVPHALHDYDSPTWSAALLHWWGQHG